MKFGKRRFLRFTIAMALAGIISSQIPVTGVTAFAQDTYNGSSSSNSGIRNVIQAAIFLLIGYAIYATIRDSSGTAAAGEAAGAAAGGTSPVVAGAGQRTIYDILAGDPNSYKSVKAAVDQTPDIRDIYKNTSKDRNGVYTVFAPDETAFAKLPNDQLTALMSPANAAQLQSLLSYHTVKGRYTIADLKALPDGTNLVTLSNTTVVVNNAGGVLKVDGVPVVESDQEAINGIVHPIQTVLTPGAVPVGTPATPGATTTTPADTGTTPPAGGTTPPAGPAGPAGPTTPAPANPAPTNPAPPATPGT